MLDLLAFGRPKKEPREELCLWWWRSPPKIEAASDGDLDRDRDLDRDLERCFFFFSTTYL